MNGKEGAEQHREPVTQKKESTGIPRLIMTNSMFNKQGEQVIIPRLHIRNNNTFFVTYVDKNGKPVDLQGDPNKAATQMPQAGAEKTEQILPRWKAIQKIRRYQRFRRRRRHIKSESDEE